MNPELMTISVEAWNAHVETIRRYREACRIARDRFCSLNGQVSEQVWNENYPAVKALKEVLK